MFDNIGDVLSMPPILMEKYLAAAETISEEAIVAGPSAKGSVKTWNSETLGSDAGESPRGDGTLILTSEGEIVVEHQFPRNANYVILVRLYQKSILDFVRDDAQQLRNRLGMNDRRKIWVKPRPTRVLTG